MNVRLTSTFLLLALLSFSVSTLAADASLLKPPAGSKVAIVVFEDLECPDCANAYPVVWETANAHKIPVVLHDFPLPRHNWSFEAAVWARYFDTKDTKTQKIGNEFRRFIFSSQRQITKENLQQWVQKFGDENKVPVPFAKDPDGSLAEKVKADYALGQRIGVEHTPTIWVVGNGGVSQPFVEEVKDRGQLNQMIEDMMAKAQPAGPSKSAPAKKSSTTAAKKQSAKAK
ncbi:MAG TPA: thioredoxin domain-containing protein [Candidatus Sulfotelmatobacter sp.]|nr:thioredoxin domain-containing protein [Candidatus Sulfotelmatobacter sp.]